MTEPAPGTVASTERPPVSASSPGSSAGLAPRQRAECEALLEAGLAGYTYLLEA